MKQIVDFKLIEKAECERSVWMRFRSETALPGIGAGQFLQVRVDGSPSTYLRRPISIHDVNPENNEISLLVQKVGEGTRHLAETKEGGMVNMVLPLGNGYTLPENKDEKVLLVGGGIGIAPLFYLGRKLKDEGFAPVFLLGGRSEKDLIRIEEYRKLGEVLVTTEDGTLGEKGFVTQHSVWKSRRFDKVYVCGPKPMMKAVVALTKDNDIWCEISLENMMACGLGACLCCVEKTVEGNTCVCKEGPVFNRRRLLW